MSCAFRCLLYMSCMLWCVVSLESVYKIILFAYKKIFLRCLKITSKPNLNSMDGIKMKQWSKQDSYLYMESHERNTKNMLKGKFYVCYKTYLLWPKPFLSYLCYSLSQFSLLIIFPKPKERVSKVHKKPLLGFDGHATIYLLMKHSNVLTNLYHLVGGSKQQSYPIGGTKL